MKSKQTFNAQQTDLLFGLIHVGPQLLLQFIQTTEKDLKAIYSHIAAAQSGEVQSIINNVLAIVHAIKGNAALFDLTIYVQLAHELEDKLLVLKNKNIQLLNTPAIINRVENMEIVLQSTRDMLSELIEIQDAQKQESDNESFINNINLLIEDISKLNNARVQLHHKNFDLSAIDKNYHTLLIEILTQLIRNALVHGIEPYTIRKEIGKYYKGSILLSSERQSSYYKVTVYDDGYGINIRKIKQQLKKKYPDRVDIDEISNEDLVSLLFESGVSTADNTTRHAGRGVGLDLVYQSINKLGGKLDFSFSQGNGCMFVIYLPLL